MADSIAESFTIYTQVGWLDDGREGTFVLAMTTSPGESVLGSFISSCWTLLDFFGLFGGFLLGNLPFFLPVYRLRSTPMGKSCKHLSHPCGAGATRVCARWTKFDLIASIRIRSSSAPTATKTRAETVQVAADHDFGLVDELDSGF
jgi:hypothetical protein